MMGEVLPRLPEIISSCYKKNGISATWYKCFSRVAKEMLLRQHGKDVVYWLQYSQYTVQMAAILQMYSLKLQVSRHVLFRA